MNKTISEFARKELKRRLALCTDGQNMIFKRMYSHKNIERPLDEVVDAMPDDKLDWALTQVENTLRKFHVAA